MLKLKKFNRSLVDHYSPEGSSTRFEKNWFGIHDIIFYHKQKEDFNNSLVFAEQEILPVFRTQASREMITPALLEQWIKKIHTIAAKTLLKNLGFTSGEYSKETLLRWEPSSELSQSLCEIFHFIPITKRNDYIKAAFKQYNQSDICEQWLSMFQEAHEYPKYHIFVSSGSTEWCDKLLRIVSARHLDILTNEQKNAFDKICSYVLHQDIESKIKDFCHRLSEDIRHCDGQLDKVILLGAKAFRDFTKIHPFVNGNGRVSNVLLNTILVGYGFDTVILRTEVDRANENSMYHTVIKKMDNDISYLTKYIKCIMAQKTNTYPTLLAKKPDEGSGVCYGDELMLLVKRTHTLVNKLNHYHRLNKVPQDEMNLNFLSINIGYQLAANQMGEKFNIFAITEDLNNEIDNHISKLKSNNTN